MEHPEKDRHSKLKQKLLDRTYQISQGKEQSDAVEKELSSLRLEIRKAFEKFYLKLRKDISISNK